MKEQEIKIKNRSHHPLPAYSTFGASGMDVRAYLPNGPIIIPAGKRALIPTGIYLQLPEGFECQIRPRSGLALNYGITVLNTPGTVDSDYRGEVGVILMNTGEDDFTVNDGDRISQMVITTYTKVKWNEVERLDRTGREDGGFGHTGEK